MLRCLLPGLVGLSMMAGLALADGYDDVRTALDAGDYHGAYATLARMGDAGDTLAMAMLANLQLGYATSGPNYGLAVAWLEEAADAGSIHAMIQLGWMYQFQAPALDREATQPGALYPRAIRWFRRAVNAGSDVGLIRIGQLYRLGLISMSDPDLTREDERRLAQQALAQAAEAGHPEAMSALALEVLRDDPNRAGALAQQAAALGDPLAIGLLAMNPTDYGVDDPIETLAWALLTEVRWAMDRNPRSEMFLPMTIAGVAAEPDLRAWVAEQRSTATLDVAEAAEALAAEVSALWTSLLPGHSHEYRSGGLFGPN